MAFDSTRVASLLKTRYDSRTPTDLTMRKNVLFAMIKKTADFSGDYFKAPVIYANPSRSRTFTNAQTNATTVLANHWLMDVTKDYSILQVPSEHILRARDKEGAFLDYATGEIERHLDVIDDNTGTNLYRSSQNVKGTCNSSGPSTGVCTLTDVRDTDNFEVGMVLQAFNSTTVRAGLGYVIAVNRDAGTITVSATAGGNAGDPSGWAANDSYVADGDIGASAVGLGLNGLPDVLTTSVPTTTLHGMLAATRAKDNRLWGTYQTSVGTIEDTIKQGLAKGYRRGGLRGEVNVFLHPDRFVQLETSMMSGGFLKRIDAKSMDGKYGFTGIQITYGGGTATVLADPKCPYADGYGLDMSDIELKYMPLSKLAQKNKKIGAGLISFAQNDGIMQMSASDAYEFRAAAWCNMLIRGPGNHVRFAW